MKKIQIKELSPSLNQLNENQDDDDDDLDKITINGKRKLMSVVVPVINNHINTVNFPNPVTESLSSSKLDSINEINGDIFNLNSIDSKEYFFTSKSKHKLKKSKHKKDRSRSRPKKSKTHSKRNTSWSSTNSEDLIKKPHRSRTRSRSRSRNKSRHANSTKHENFSNQINSNSNNFDTPNPFRLIKTPPLPCEPSKQDKNSQNLPLNIIEPDKVPPELTPAPIPVLSSYTNYYNHNYQSNYINQKYCMPQYQKNNLIVIKPAIQIEEEQTKSPINQCQEISSTNQTNQNEKEKNDYHFGQLNRKSLSERLEALNFLKNEFKIQEPIFEVKKIEIEKFYDKPVIKELADEEIRPDVIVEKPLNNNEDDLVALKNKFRLQLEQQLFDKTKSTADTTSSNQNEKVDDKVTSTDTSFSETNKVDRENDLSSSESLDHSKAKRSKQENRKRRHHKSHHHHRSHKSSTKHHHHNKHESKYKKSKQKAKFSKKSKLNEKDLDSEMSLDEDQEKFLLNDDDLASLRRSDRIKVIETKKQHHKELEIANKLRKRSNHEPTENNLLDSASKDDSVTDFQKSKDQDNSLISDSSSPVQSLSILPQINQNSPNSLQNVDSLNGIKRFSLNKSANDSQVEQTSEKFVWPSDYEQIDENLYVCKRKNNKNKESKRMICDCSTSEQERQSGIQACGIDCLNRMLLIECGNRCPCGEYCTNRNFKLKNNAKMLPFKTESKGWGLKAAIDFKAETFLIEYVGEVIDLKEFKKRCEKYAEQNNQHFYFMSLQNELFLDATKKGNMSRFFNHSCDPNCETQKWTVNGELRIGFFTRRPVQANEELTFDYQFQTVGKKQQKCYCGSEKCRGFLGASGNNQSNQLDYIWEDDSSDEMESDEDSELEKSVREDSESEHEKESKKNAKNNKKQKDNKDFDLKRQINSIRSLSNKENVLKLCQLMFRTENLPMRLDLLNLLLNTKSEISLRLFMDYHGLKLLWGWMIDIDSINDNFVHLECKLKILKVLSMLPIKNRTILEECKLLTLVKKWSEVDLRPKADLNEIINEINHDGLNQSDNKDISIKNLLDKVVDKLVDKIFDNAYEKFQENPNFKELFDLLDDIKEKAKSLYEEWSNLKQAFKIPKKQQIEERKEHERELNRTESTKTENESKPNNTDWSLSPKHSQPNQAYPSNKPFYSTYRYNNRGFGRNQFYRRPFFNYQKPVFNKFQSGPMLTKEQRRQLFEQKVKEEEEKAAAEAAAKQAAEAEAARIEAEKTKCQHGQAKWIYDVQTNQWVQCFVQPVIPNYFAVPPPPPNEQNSLGEKINRINLSQSHLNDLKQAIQQFKSSTPETVKNDRSSPLRNVSMLLATRNDSNRNSKSLSSISARLPPNWKCKRNEKGHVYYYNVKTKKTQWHFPKVVKPKISLTNKIVKKEEPKEEKEVKNSPIISSTTVEGADTTSKMKTVEDSNSTAGPVSNSSSSEIFKIYKDQFREKLSKLVVKVLQPYLKSDCAHGHIQNTSDFKHLARKFTHTIMEKEMSRATKLEELELDKRIKLKTHEYISRYMQKFSGDYSRTLDSN